MNNNLNAIIIGISIIIGSIIIGSQIASKKTNEDEILQVNIGGKISTYEQNSPRESKQIILKSDEKFVVWLGNEKLEYQGKNLVVTYYHVSKLMLVSYGTIADRVHLYFNNPTKWQIE